MHSAEFLVVLLLVPLVTAYVAMRLIGDRTLTVVACAVAAELIALPLVRMWSHHAATRALEQARLAHRDFAYFTFHQTLGQQIFVTTLWALVATIIASAVLGISQAARK